MIMRSGNYFLKTFYKQIQTDRSHLQINADWSNTFTNKFRLIDHIYKYVKGVID